MWQHIPLWPQQGASLSHSVDLLYVFLLVVTGGFTILIFALIAYFAVKYRQRTGHQATQIEGSYALEATWTLIPFGIFMVMFVWGAAVYMKGVQPPADSMDIFVVGKQWMWKVEHPEGVREIDALHVPLGRDVRLTLISQDVIHSFFVPAFRIKQDVLPGRYTTMWFHPTKVGTYHLFCAEYCGTLHSGMIGEVTVMRPGEYDAWLHGNAAAGTMVTDGERVFAQLGCSSCHRSGSQGRGPSLAGVYGHQVALDDGQTVEADDNYIRESIMNPGAKVVAGFSPIMPTYNGIVSEDQMLSLLSYMKSLSQPQSAEPGNSQQPATANPGENNASGGGNKKVK